MVPIFMRFLYCWTSISLEDLCDKRHFGPTRVSELNPDQFIGGKAARSTGSSLISVAGTRGSTEMLDIVMLAIGLGFFALSVGYTMACDHL
jgi:hypothetical protein